MCDHYATMITTTMFDHYTTTITTTTTFGFCLACLRVMCCWHGYLSGLRCRSAYGSADVTATPSLDSLKSRTVYLCVCLYHAFIFRVTELICE